MISRIVEIMDKINKGKINSPDLIVENTGMAVFNKQKQDLIKKLTKKYVGKTQHVTERHIAFMVEIFGTQYAKNMDPRAVTNIFKNPNRFLNKIRNEFGDEKLKKLISTMEGGKAPNSKDAIIEILQKENEDKDKRIEQLTKKLEQMANQRDIDVARRDLLLEFSDFIKNRKGYRKKITEENLKGMLVSFFDGVDVKIKEGKVVLDYNHASDEDILASFGGETVVNEDASDEERIKNARLLSKNCVLIESDSEHIIHKRAIIPNKYHDIIDNSETLTEILSDDISNDKEFYSVFDGKTKLKDIIKVLNNMGMGRYDINKAQNTLGKWGFSRFNMSSEGAITVNLHHKIITINTELIKNQNLIKTMEVVKRVLNPEHLIIDKDNEQIAINHIKKSSDTEFYTGNMFFKFDSSLKKIELIKIKIDETKPKGSELITKLRDAEVHPINNSGMVIIKDLN